jgi:death on curing protein
LREPVWISRATCDAIHSDQLRQHGGKGGIRDEGALESALARPRNKFVYDQKAGLFSLAASYAYGLARNHGYVDGNKRVAFLAMYTFLGINGINLEALEEEVVDVIVQVAAGELSETGLSNWLAKHCNKRRQR